MLLPRLIVTLGGSIAAVYSRPRLPLDWEFATHRQPLPAFAKELGIDNWAQYFLKWVASHPAVTCVLPATSNPDHVAQNIAALRGPMPDRAMRDRMLRHVQSILGLERALQMPWYPDKRYAGIINRSQAELRART